MTSAAELAMKHYVQALTVLALSNGKAKGLIIGLGEVTAKRMACAYGDNGESVALMWRPTGKRAIVPESTYYATCTGCETIWEDQQ